MAFASSLALLNARAPERSLQQQQQQQQQRPAGNQQQPTFRTEARLVRVDTYVTDGGRPVEDLRADDFRVFEDGVQQKVESFEQVRQGEVVAGRAPGEPERLGRLFVLFIDTYHLPWVDRDRLERRERNAPKYQPEPFRFPVVLPPPIPDDSMFRDALAEIINRVVGPDDRVAVLTPDMWAASLTFMERKAAVEELATRSLTAYVAGQRPPELNHFEACFPEGPEIEPEMRMRYRLYRTFTTLSELMGNLELAREERKAVFAITRGWDPPPRIRGYRDPRTGMIGEDDTVCHEERLALADKDFDAWFRSIVNDAKRANVAFYSVYAHPLVTWGRSGSDIDEDTRRYQRQWGDPSRPGDGLLYGEFPAIEHNRMLWQGALTDMAKDTNGRAILKGGEDFEKGLKDISDTLSSYYLLGYYSTNTKRDTGFRKISVTVNRKGAVVRARPGYRAVIPAEAQAAEAVARPDLVPPYIITALAPLARLRADVPLHVAATPEWDAAAGGWRLRIVGEIDSVQAKRDEWRRGWRAEVTVTGPDAKPVGAAGITMKAGLSSFSVSYPTSGALPPGEYEVRAKAVAADLETVFDERTSAAVPAAAAANQPVLGQPMFSRRPNAPRTEFQATADNRFSRREVMQIEVPIGGAADSPTLRLVDRQGQPLGVQIPATIVERNGGRLATAAIALSNVAPGDYVIEIAASDKAPDQKIYVAFRVVP